MGKPLKYTLFGLAGLVVLLVAAVAVFALTFDPNRYKTEIERLVKEKTGRTLKLQGDIGLAFWPALGAKVAGITLTERGSDAQFVALESAHASVAVMPLLRGAAVVDGIRISGLKANVIKGKDGRFNFSDLLEAGGADAKKPAEKAPAGGGAVAFDIASFRLDRSSVRYLDQASGQELSLEDLLLATGHIAERADGKLELKGKVKGKKPDLDLAFDLGGNYQIDLPAKAYSLSKLDARLNGSADKRAVNLAVTGSAQANMQKENVEADLVAKFDESTIKAKLGLPKLSPPAYAFDINVDRFNVDRYFPPATASAKPEAKSDKPQGETPVDLSALKGLNANGQLQVGALQVRGLKLANLKAKVQAANGKLDVAPHSAELYQGTLTGALSAQADGNRVALKENLSGVAIGPLLADLANKDLLEGKGNVALDVTAAGATVEQMKKALAGKANVQLKDGAIKGINLAESVRKAKSMLGGGGGGAEQGSSAADKTQKTDFSEMSASFAIKNGVAHNEDLDVKSPLFRIGGAGDIDIGNSKLNYLTKASVVATTKGQGGDDLGSLKGLTVPVRLTGSFEDPKYSVDYGAAAGSVAKSQAADKVKEEVNKQLKGLLKR